MISMNHLELPASNMGGDGGSPMSRAITYPQTNTLDLQNPRSSQNGPIAGARLTATDMGEPPCSPMSETGLALAADQLVAEWSEGHITLAGQRERSLVEYALRQLADPRSDHGGLLDDICCRRATAGVAS